ncbi:glycosyltransferase family 2 protein [Actinokineospora sp.]|uniref:glycosyltransferase family 2 protein n=1 Tax=Actinokineospora sp. TaxID=1872133 RepID=UPI004037771A
MPLLSIITAAHGPQATFLPDTAASLAEQTLPACWEFEWLVQQDGEGPSVRDMVPRARFAANGRLLGIAATRNLALSRARGDLVRVLDHDDVLLPGSLARPLPLFADPSVHWTLTGADEIDAVGTRTAMPEPPRVGRVPRGAVGAVTDTVGRWSLLCAGMTARTDSVRALGGWLATPRSEDVGLLTVLAELTDGHIIPEATWCYRRHTAQTHLTPDWRQRADEGVRVVTQRLAAAKRTGLRFA